MKYLCIFLIRLYQLTFGSFTSGQCRFYPSCSNYGIEVMKKYGCLKGFYLTIKRICKCHPWHQGGVDQP